MTKKSWLGIPRAVLLVGAVFSVAGCRRAAPVAPAASATPAAATATQPAAAKVGAAGEALPPGIDLGKLDASKRKVFDQVVGRESSVCGKGHSLLHSASQDPSCRASFYAVRYVARLAEAGSNETEIAEKLAQRFRTAAVPYIDVSQAPSKGSPAGQVKIVEFADYECTHCREAQAVLRPLLAEYASDVTFYFKHFPLGGNAGSLNAAFGAAAAQNQGKFWAFSDKVWESALPLTPALLEGIAKEIGLDFSRFYADVGTEEVRAHVQRDRAEARSLEIHRTPAIFINGRRYSDEIDLASLKDWIDEALGR